MQLKKFSLVLGIAIVLLSFQNCKTKNDVTNKVGNQTQSDNESQGQELDDVAPINGYVLDQFADTEIDSITLEHEGGLRAPGSWSYRTEIHFKHSDKSFRIEYYTWNFSLANGGEERLECPVYVANAKEYQDMIQKLLALKLTAGVAAMGADGGVIALSISMAGQVHDFEGQSAFVDQRGYDVILNLNPINQLLLDVKNAECSTL